MVITDTHSNLKIIASIHLEICGSKSILVANPVWDENNMPNFASVLENFMNATKWLKLKNSSKIFFPELFIHFSFGVIQKLRGQKKVVWWSVKGLLTPF